MARTRWIWLVLAVLYAAFFSGYTSFGGPLSDEEIDGYMAMATGNAESPPPEKLAILRRFLEEDTGDDFVMVNVIDMYDTPLQIVGGKSARGWLWCSSSWGRCFSSRRDWPDPAPRPRNGE